MLIQYQIPRNLLEVYKTDEENFEPYTPKSSYDDTGEDEREEEEEELEDEEDEGEEEEDAENKDGFSLHQGEILETYYYPYLFSTENEYDYEEIDFNGSIDLPSVNDNECYKGVRLLMRKGMEKEGEHLDLKNLPETCLGFITEQTYSQDNVALKVSGMTKLLEKEYEFDFTQMKMSDILCEMIKTAGLIPAVNPTGLDDRIIDYSNVSKDEEDDGAYSGDLPAEACAAAKKITKGKKSKKAKAQAIYDWIDSTVKYRGYNNSEFNEQNVYSKAREGVTMNCCDHAHLSVVLLRCVGIKANYVHGPGHVWAVAYIEGGKVMFDPLGYQNRPMGQVWNGLTGSEMESIGF